MISTPHDLRPVPHVGDESKRWECRLCHALVRRLGAVTQESDDHGRTWQSAVPCKLTAPIDAPAEAA